MIRRTWIVAAALAATVAAHAQTTGAPAPSSPAKKDLIARILKVQQPGIEAMARRLVEQPAAEILGVAGNAIPQRIAKDKQEAVARDIQADVQKFVADTAPQVQQRAIALAPSTIGALLDERFTEDELRQIAGFMESPVYAKFQRAGDDMQRVLIERLVTETRPTVEPKVHALDDAIARRLGVNPAPANSAPAPAAKAPAKK